MKYRVTRFLVFLLAFQGEIRVRASSFHQTIAKPPGCWQQSMGECFLQSGSRPVHIQFEGASIWTGKDSFLKRSETLWAVSKGTFRIQTQENFEIQFPIGRAFSSSGEFWIIESRSRFLVRAVSKDVEVKITNEKKILIPEGMEVWFKGLDQLSEWQFGVPQVFSLEEHLKNLRDEMDTNPEEIKAIASDLKKKWKNRREIASKIYQEVSNKHLQDQKIAEELAAENIQKEKETREHFRKLLFEKAFTR